MIFSHLLAHLKAKQLKLDHICIGFINLNK